MTFPVYATSPLPYVVAGAVVLAVAWRQLPTGWRIAGVVLEVALIVLMTPFAARSLMRAVAARAPPASACTPPEPRAIVVLAGGFARAPQGPNDFGALRQISLQRVFAGVALWRRHPQARLVFSGGGGRGVPEALAMGNLAIQLGVPAAAIQLEGHSHTTWENAHDVASLVPPVPRRIWLVTSPLHLPRALGAFRAWGFAACAAPAGPVRVGVSRQPSDFIPQANAARQTAYVLHEIIGGFEYRVLEWRHARAARASSPFGTKGD